MTRQNKQMLPSGTDEQSLEPLDAKEPIDLRSGQQSPQPSAPHLSRIKYFGNVSFFARWLYLLPIAAQGGAP